MQATTKTTDNTSKSGMTLIETLVTLSLASMIIASTFVVMSQGQRMLRSAEAQTLTLHQARGTMEYLRTLNFNSEEMKIGNHSITKSGIKYKYTVSKYANNDELKRILLKAKWTSPVTGKTKTMKFNTAVSLHLH